jgi:hypothetical protein
MGLLSNDELLFGPLLLVASASIDETDPNVAERAHSKRLALQNETP